MSIEKLKRVMWRLSESCPDAIVRQLDLERAIFMEIGTDRRTYKKNRRALLKLGWIIHQNYKYKISKSYETEDPDW